MDRRGAPPKTWLLCSEYLADVHNIALDESLRWHVPFTIRHGETSDISDLLYNQFYKKIYYLDPGKTFPRSKSKLSYKNSVATCQSTCVDTALKRNGMEMLPTREIMYSGGYSALSSPRIFFQK